MLRDRIEPAVNDMKREFTKFQKTIENVGEMANDGMRVINEFTATRAQSSSLGGDRTSH